MTKIGIVVTSYAGHEPYFKITFGWMGRVPYPIVFGWDDDEPYEEKERPLLPETVVEKIWTGKRLYLQTGENWQIFKGVEFFSQTDVEYVLKVSGDQDIKHPEFIAEMPGRMHGLDVVYMKGGNRRRFETKSFFGRTEALWRLMSAHSPEIWTKRHLCQRYRKIEMSLAGTATELGITYGQNLSAWKEGLGYRHYHSHKSKIMQNVWWKTGEGYPTGERRNEREKE